MIDAPRACGVLASLLLVTGGCVADPVTFGSGGGDAAGPGATSGTSAQTGGQTSATTGGQGGEAPLPATFELSLSQTSSTIELRDSVELEITIAENGYVGPVDLSVLGLSAELSALLESDTVTLDGAGETVVTLTLSSASDSVVGNYTFDVMGSVVSGDKQASGDVTIEPVITITIPVNLASYDMDPPSTNAFGDYPTVLKALPQMSAQNPITVRFFNEDTIPHQIHASNPDQGFGHGNVNIPAGGYDPMVRNVNAPGTYNYYPHDLGPGIAGRIVIE